MQNKIVEDSEVQNTRENGMEPRIFSEWHAVSDFAKEDDYLTESESDSYLSGSE